MKRLAFGNSVLLPYLLILAVAVVRLTVSQPFHLVPVLSCLMFFGAYRSKREFAIPFLALVGVDIFLTTHHYGFALDVAQAVTWVGYLCALILGAGMLGSKAPMRRVVAASLLVSVSFFAISNFAVWAEWGMYPKTWSGLGLCYIAALPFFRNSIFSETFFSLLIFGAYRYYETSTFARRMHAVCS